MIADPDTKALHDARVASGHLPADAPADFVIPEDGLGGGPNGNLPWWFPPDFAVGERGLLVHIEDDHRQRGLFDQDEP